MISENGPPNPNHEKTQQHLNDQSASEVGPSQQDIQGLISLCNSGQMADAESQAKKLLEKFRNAPVLYNILGSALATQGKLEEAAATFQCALKGAPNYAQAHSNLGLTLARLHRLEEAVTSLQQAVSIDPSKAQAHSNLGKVLVDQGKCEEGVVSYQRALKINPNLSGIHNNLGSALIYLGKLDEAISSYYQSLKLSPNAATYYNLHSLLIDPEDMTPAVRCLEDAVDLEPSNNTYKLFLGMLLEYAGRTESATILFKEVQQGSNLDKARLDAWNYIKSANKEMPRMIGSPIEAFRLGMDSAPDQGLVLEFGVRFGVTIRNIASLTAQEVHGFDSFEGLPEEWHGEGKGTYTTKGVIPEVPNNVHLHKGWFENSLPEFIKTHKDPIRFMNIDCDIYSSTKTILDCLSSQVIPGTIIVFDEYIGTGHWREDEFKAFQEAVSAYGWNYEYLAFSMFTKQVVVRMT